MESQPEQINTSDIDSVNAVQKAQDLPILLEKPQKSAMKTTKSVFGVRPVAVSQIEVIKTFLMAGVRPVGASLISVAQKDTNNSVVIKRPVAPNSGADSPDFTDFMD